MARGRFLVRDTAISRWYEHSISVMASRQSASVSQRGSPEIEHNALKLLLLISGDSLGFDTAPFFIFCLHYHAYRLQELYQVLQDAIYRMLL